MIRGAAVQNVMDANLYGGFAAFGEFFTNGWLGVSQRSAEVLSLGFGGPASLTDDVIARGAASRGATMLEARTVGAAQSAGGGAFKVGEDVIHFEKHGSEIAQTLGIKDYSVAHYVSDANAVIRNGTFVPEINAFVLVPGGTGSAKGVMVGIDRATGEITTMHMKPVTWFDQKAPSLGWEAQPRSVRTDTIGPNSQSGWKPPY